MKKTKKIITITILTLLVLLVTPTAQAQLNFFNVFRGSETDQAHIINNLANIDPRIRVQAPLSFSNNYYFFENGESFTLRMLNNLVSAGFRDLVVTSEGMQVGGHLFYDFPPGAKVEPFGEWHTVLVEFPEVEVFELNALTVMMEDEESPNTLTTIFPNTYIAILNGQIEFPLETQVIRSTSYNNKNFFYIESTFYLGPNTEILLIEQDKIKARYETTCGTFLNIVGPTYNFLDSNFIGHDSSPEIFEVTHNDEQIPINNIYSVIELFDPKLNLEHENKFIALETHLLDEKEIMLKKDEYYFGFLNGNKRFLYPLYEEFDGGLIRVEIEPFAPAYAIANDGSIYEYPFYYFGNTMHPSHHLDLDIYLDNVYFLSQGEQEGCIIARTYGTHNLPQEETINYLKRREEHRINPSDETIRIQTTDGRVHQAALGRVFINEQQLTRNDYFTSNLQNFYVCQDNCVPIGTYRTGGYSP